MEWRKIEGKYVIILFYSSKVNPSRCTISQIYFILEQ